MATGQPGEDLASNGVAPEADQETAALSTSEEVWDEERIEKALKTLKEMHIQLRGLRTTLPRLIAPLATKQPTPAALFQEFSQAGKNANQEIAQFRELMQAEDTTKALEQAKKSRAEKPKGIKPWKVTDHPDWLTRDEE